MVSSSFHLLVVVLTLVSEGLSLPYRAFSSRSVPGRIRSSSRPESVKDYLSYYLDTIKRGQQPYGLSEYEPTYQQGYLSRRPQVNPETLAALLPYISQTEAGDYSYDYNNAPSNSYSDDEGTWYDNAFAPESYPAIDSRDKNNEQAALMQLFLDHLTGKYSLEDLETLEREAVMEDNTENQLHALLPQKKSSLPMLGSRATARNIISYPVRQGQKEEPFNVPASSIRRPVFTRSQATPQKADSAPVTTSTLSSVLSKEEKSVGSSASPVDKETSLSKTMDPSIKTAYDAFKTYLSQERAVRQNLDESSSHTPQKRFIRDPKSLSQQLESLKKTRT